MFCAVLYNIVEHVKRKFDWKIGELVDMVGTACIYSGTSIFMSLQYFKIFFNHVNYNVHFIWSQILK